MPPGWDNIAWKTHYTERDKSLSEYSGFVSELEICDAQKEGRENKNDERPEGMKRNEVAQYIQGMLLNCLMAATL